MLTVAAMGQAFKSGTPEQQQQIRALIWPEMTAEMTPEMTGEMSDDCIAGEMADDYIAKEGGGTIGFVEKYKKLKAALAPKPRASKPKTFRVAALVVLDIEDLLNDLKDETEEDLLREPAQKLRDYWCALRNVDKSVTSSGKLHSKRHLVDEIVRLMKDTFAEDE